MHEARFSSVVALVTWHLTTGRERMGGLKAIDNEPRPRGARDFWRMEETHALFALTSRCLGAVTDRQRQLLEAAYRARLSDLRIAERLHSSETTIRRERNRALRAIEDEAHRLAGVAMGQLERCLLEADE